MMAINAARVAEAPVRPLRQREIDRRIEMLVSDIAAPADGEDGEQDLRPKWISAGELVRRMQPFVVHN